MRACGSCTLCCKLVPVEELGKLAGQRCLHQRHGKGCSIYERRPLSCREWSCMWLTGSENGKPLDLSRPDHAGYVIDTVPDIVRATNNETGEVTQITVLQIWVDPARPEAWRDPALLAMLERGGIVGLVRFDSSRGLTVWPPTAVTDGRWHFTDTQSAEDLRGAQRAARHEFWSKQIAEQRS